MAQRMVKCTLLKKELPGIEEPPWPGELGKRIYENVSQEAWSLWEDRLRMLINEYRLNLANQQAQEVIGEQMEAFFFGQDAGLPPGHSPES